MPRRRRILVTGFEPFGGSSVNPSREVLPLLEAEAPRGIDLRTEVLPVIGGPGAGAAPARLAASLRRHRPEILVCLGETGARGAICLERIAINLRDYRIADNAGAKVEDRPIDPRGPLALMSTLPVRPLLEAMRATGAPCELSLSAGAFLCNEVMYHALRLTRRRSGVMAGFIHLPQLPEQHRRVARGDGATRGSRGARGAAAAGPARTLPLRVTAGALLAALEFLRDRRR